MRRIRRADTQRDYRASSLSARAVLRVAPGYLPIIGLYGWMALLPQAFGHEQIVWLVVMQFVVVEMMACAIAVFVGAGLGRRSDVVPWYADPRTYPTQRRARDPGKVRIALIVLGGVLLGVVPALVQDAFGDAQRSWGVAAAFLPRVLDAWRLREVDPDHDPRPARALMHGGFAGWGMALLCALLVWMLSASGAPLPLVRDAEVPAWSRIAGALIVLYYVGAALVSARLHHDEGRNG